MVDTSDIPYGGAVVVALEVDSSWALESSCCLGLNQSALSVFIGMVGRSRTMFPIAVGGRRQWENVSMEVVKRVALPSCVTISRLHLSRFKQNAINSDVPSCFCRYLSNVTLNFELLKTTPPPSWRLYIHVGREVCH